MKVDIKMLNCSNRTLDYTITIHLRKIFFCAQKRVINDTVSAAVVKICWIFTCQGITKPFEQNLVNNIQWLEEHAVCVQ